MSLGASNLLLASAGDEGYNLTRSLRFRASASAYLNRTPASAGNQNTWTWSGWVKRGALGSGQRIFGTSSTGTSDNNLGDFYFSSADKIGFFQYNAGTTYTNIESTQVFRDPSAWYHIILAYDDTQATAANRVKIYVNGAQITSFSTASYPTQNFTGFFNAAQPHIIGRYTGAGSNLYYDGYLTEINFVNAQALTPSSFGSTNALTGVWQPARYAGTYGTNGFYLPFTDNSALTTSSNVGLGKDFSGNGNYWTTNNISITAGVTYDSMTDVPTLTSATAANYCVMNPLDSNANVTISNGNLLLTTSANNYGARASIGINTGQWYWEATVVALGTNAFIGIADPTWTKNYVGSSLYSWSYVSAGQKYNNGASPAYGATFTTGDIIGVAFDATAGSLTFYKNGTSQGVAFTGISSPLPLFPALSGWTSTSIAINFGQRPFSYTPPTGFVALNTFNLPTSAIVKGNTVFDATTYTGTGASLSVTNAAAFKPDLVWVKGRSGATDHALYDSVRGTTKQLESNTTTAETTEATGLTAFGSAGFTVGALAQMNTSAATYVGWQWQAGQGSSSSNTNGTITSTVSVNASAGFSVVTYTGTGANATVGHGLGVAPAFYVVKARNYGSGGNWVAWHTSIGQPNALWMNLTNAQFSYPTAFNSTNPTSSVLSLGTAPEVNNSGSNFVAYCWTPIAGYSAFGSYTGNANAAGPFIYTGFRPSFVLVKCSSAANSWVIWDNARNSYNQENLSLLADSSGAEINSTDLSIDTLSNGFKLKGPNANSNASGATYIYMAFAETPFKNSLGR